MGQIPKWLDERHRQGERVAAWWHLALSLLSLGEVVWHGLSMIRHLRSAKTRD